MGQQLKNFLYPPLLALIISGGVIFIYISFFSRNEKPQGLSLESVNTTKVVNSKFDLSLFKEESFQRLKYYGE